MVLACGRLPKSCVTADCKSAVATLPVGVRLKSIFWSKLRSNPVIVCPSLTGGAVNEQTATESVVTVAKSIAEAAVAEKETDLPSSCSQLCGAATSSLKSSSQATNADASMSIYNAIFFIFIS